MKLNKLGRQKLGRYTYKPCKQAQHPKLYSDLLIYRLRKREPLIGGAGDPLTSASAVPHRRATRKSQTNIFKAKVMHKSTGMPSLNGTAQILPEILQVKSSLV